MSSHAGPHLGATLSTTPPGDMTAATTARVIDLAHVRQTRTHGSTRSSPGLGQVDGDLEGMSSRHRSTSHEHASARRSGSVTAVQADAHRPDSEIAIVVQRDFAITVRAAAVRTAQPLAEAIGRVLQALVTPNHDRCRIEATARGLEVPSLVIDCPTGDAQTLDTLLRCLESIVGAALRAKVVVHEGTRARIRTWVGAWIEPEAPTPHPRSDRSRVRASASPVMA
jgi:hypothetical protein